MKRIGGDERETLNRRRATHPTGDGNGDGGKKKRKMVDLQLKIFQNPQLRAYSG